MDFKKSNFKTINQFYNDFDCKTIFLGKSDQKSLLQDKLPIKRLLQI